MTPIKFLEDIPPIAFIALTLAILVFGADIAHAAPDAKPQDAGEEIALLPMPEAPLTLAARCDDGVAVFSVKNNAAPWKTRGEIRVIDSATGHVIRARSLALGERQAASFRVPGSDARSGRYRVAVSTADGAIVYVKSFVGQCIAPNADPRTARR